MSDELIKLPVTFNETSVGPMFSDADGLNLAAFSAIGDEKAIGEYIATCINEHESLKAQLAEAQAEIERLKELLIDDGEPAFGWCDVDGCDKPASNGGTCWRETGYWSVCYEHSDSFYAGDAQPQMKQASIDKEATRDPVTGFLPFNSSPE